MSPRRAESDLERALLFGIKALKLPVPVEQYQFHPVRKWRFDFAWPALMVACEVEGGTWSNGAHVRGRHFESDCEKGNEAACMGWLVLRVTGDMVEDGRAANFLKRLLSM